MQYELLTGATGLLGSQLLSQSVAAGRHLAVLVRSQSGRSARQRVSEPEVKVVQGDLTRPDLGLSQEDEKWLAEHCQRVVHCAASLQFQVQASTSEPYRTNVDGLRHLLGLCQRLHIREFHLVSTAYVCGDRDGLIGEQELECGQSFHNDYERSKFLAEVLVGQAPGLDHRAIYRPSVILGQGSAFLRLAWLLGLDDLELAREKFGLEGEAGLNLVSGEWVAGCIRRLIDQRAVGTFHLTARNPFRADQLLQLCADIPRPSASVPGPVLDELLQTYRPYLRNHPGFERKRLEAALPDCGPGHLSPPELERQLRLALKALEPRLLLHVGDESIRLNPEGQDGAEVAAYCHAHTLDRLRSGQLSLHQALHNGSLHLEGDSPQLEPALSVLQAFLEGGSGP
ncbi:MAG: SDR family oxidoreductase [Vulcanimicrobiota bacterium]